MDVKDVKDVLKYLEGEAERNRVRSESEVERNRLQDERDTAQAETNKQLFETSKHVIDVLKGLVERNTNNQGQHTRTPVEIRADKVSQVNQSLRKSVRIKDYKPSCQDNIQDWISKCENEIYGLARGVCNLDLTTTELTDREYVELIRSKLEFVVIQEIEQKFAIHSPVLNWNTVTKNEIKELLIEQFGTKEPAMSSLLKMFGPSRLKKPAEMSVKNFYCKWMEEKHPIFAPKTTEEKDAFIDLVNRCAFYHSLEDPYLQKELSNIPENEQKLSKFHQEAMNAESRRLHYQDTLEKGNILDASSNVTISKFVNSGKRGRGGGRGGGARRNEG